MTRYRDHKCTPDLKLSASIINKNGHSGIDFEGVCELDTASGSCLQWTSYRYGLDRIRSSTRTLKQTRLKVANARGKRWFNAEIHERAHKQNSLYLDVVHPFTHGGVCDDTARRLYATKFRSAVNNTDRLALL